jgi:hypothetical protein
MYKNDAEWRNGKLVYSSLRMSASQKPKGRSVGWLTGQLTRLPYSHHHGATSVRKGRSFSLPLVVVPAVFWRRFQKRLRCRRQAACPTSRATSPSLVALQQLYGCVLPAFIASQWKVSILYYITALDICRSATGPRMVRLRVRNLRYCASWQKLGQTTPPTYRIDSTRLI